MKTTQRSRQFKVGLATVATGMLLAVTGLSMSPASADGEKSTICHRTNSVTNPYRQISVDLSATHGPDHATHLGPVFDYTADPEDQDYPYNPPLSADAWGDIIPNVLNWDEAGQAIFNAECQIPGEAPDPPACEFDDELEASDPLCVPPVVDACPDLAGVQATAAECPTQVSSVTVTPPVEVLGIQVVPAAPVVAAPAAALPRTGKSTLPMAELGLGLLLMGAGALIFAREQATTV